MNRYLDAEWLKEHTEFISYTGMWHETETGEFVSRETMEEAPSIDIVRCGERKHWDDRRKDDWWSEEGACYLTSRLGYATYRNHDDFCSYGVNSSEKPNNLSEIPTASERSSE